MTGIEKIIGRIEADAQLEKERILAEARAKADGIAEVYQKKADALAAELTRKGEEESEARRKRAVGVAELEARKDLLAAKQELIDAVFSAAAEKLRALPDVVPVLAKLAANASRTGGEALTLTAADRKSVGKDVTDAANALLADAGKPANLTLSEDTLPDTAVGGVKLTGDNIEVNGTFAALLANLRDEMAPEIAEILFKD
ncbi:MAG: V-type ATP synthase subunit E [Oscillospiraceae bacterium]|nr:V-type ATP synthase subunit E [Oscillospiraceae bacterium]